MLRSILRSSCRISRFGLWAAMMAIEPASWLNTAASSSKAAIVASSGRRSGSSSLTFGVLLDGLGVFLRDLAGRNVAAHHPGELDHRATGCQVKEVVEH